MNRGHKQTDVIVMDSAKAIDKVPHKRLLYKLDVYGIRGSTHKWIDSWLSERSQKVVSAVDDRASDLVPVLSGVPQGSVLGPVLFLSFIYDLLDNIRSSVRLFADDCVLHWNIESPLNCQILQDDLNSLAKWEIDWQIKFIVSKCHSVRVTRLHPSKHIQFSYTLHQQTLEQVQSAKYLGLTITDNLDWGQHISEITCKATKTFDFLRRNLALAPRHTKMLHTKHWFVINLSMQLQFGIPIMKLRLLRWRWCRGLQPGRPAGDGGTPVTSVICFTNLSGHPWSPAESGPPSPSSTRYTTVQCLLIKTNT